jgi:hypothetical protein
MMNLLQINGPSPAAPGAAPFFSDPEMAALPKSNIVFWQRCQVVFWQRCRCAGEGRRTIFALWRINLDQAL